VAANYVGGISLLGISVNVVLAGGFYNYVLLKGKASVVPSNQITHPTGQLSMPEQARAASLEQRD
jgi:hypothetical protein